MTAPVGAGDRGNIVEFSNVLATRGDSKTKNPAATRLSSPKSEAASPCWRGDIVRLLGSGGLGNDHGHGGADGLPHRIDRTEVEDVFDVCPQYFCDAAP